MCGGWPYPVQSLPATLNRRGRLILGAPSVIYVRHQAFWSHIRSISDLGWNIRTLINTLLCCWETRHYSSVGRILPWSTVWRPIWCCKMRDWHVIEIWELDEMRVGLRYIYYSPKRRERCRDIRWREIVFRKGWVRGELFGLWLPCCEFWWVVKRFQIRTTRWSCKFNPSDYVCTHSWYNFNLLLAESWLESNWDRNSS